MEFFLLRHGTRNFTLGDVPLNEEGQREAESLSNDPHLQRVQTILCSPKKRAQMTVTPLANKLGISIKTLNNLDQMERGESETDFMRRVRSQIEALDEKRWQSPVLLCSHSDWLSTACHIIPSDDPHLAAQMFACAEYLHFEVKDGLWIRRS